MYMYVSTSDYVVRAWVCTCALCLCVRACVCLLARACVYARACVWCVCGGGGGSRVASVKMFGCCTG